MIESISIVNEVPDMVEGLSGWIYDYGYLAIFILLMLSGFGVPLGEDFIIIPAGFFVAQGRLDFFTTCLVAYFGVAVADILWYMGCYFFGHKLLRRRLFKKMFHPKRMLEMKHQIDTRGIWFVAIGRFVPLSRTFMITAAGLFHLNWLKFIIPTFICIMVTVPLQVSIGWMIGKGFSGHDDAFKFQWSLGIIALLVAFGFVFSIYRKSKVKGFITPRASIVFLRKIKNIKSK